MPSREATLVEPVVTQTAHWGWHEHQYFGHPVFAGLLGDESLTGLTALSVLGRRLSLAHKALLDDIAVALTLADPRIWPLKLARTVASYGNSVAGVGAALLVQDNARIGPWTCEQAALVLTEWQRVIVESQQSLEQVVGGYLEGKRFVWGFGTPFRQADERLVAFAVRVKLRGSQKLKFWSLFEAASQIVVRERGTPPNMGMGVAAALLDIGVLPHQMGALTTSLMAHMFVAHAVEGAHRPSEMLRCLPDEAVDYRGVPARNSPSNQSVAAQPNAKTR